MRIVVSRGESLLQAMLRCKVAVDAPCAGKGTCGMCKVQVYGIGQVRACQFNKPGIYEVKLPEKPAFVTVSGERPLRRDMLVVDLGTTIVAIKARINGVEKQLSFTNPQRSLGADVLSRIAAAEAGHGALLKKLIEEKLWSALEELLQNAPTPETETMPQKARKPDSEALPIVISSNTTMGHLLRGMSVKGLGRAPFSPVTLELEREKAPLDVAAEVYYLPGISAFVGADLVSGMYDLEMGERDDLVLLLDLGTNGEMALGNRQGILVTSTSAGPAFEGSELALSLHASGLLRLLRHMREKHILDSNGLLQEPYFAEGYPLELWNQQYEGLVLTQEMVRDLQLAKAAIRAGITLLMQEYKKVGIASDQIEKVYLAGGMGYYIDPSDAAAIGLIPQELVEKCRAAGNTSLKGAIRFAENVDEASEKMHRLIGLSRELVLANHEKFEDTYISFMNF